MFMRRTLPTLALLLAGLVIAACGTSGPSPAARLVDQCVARGQTRAACTCTLDTATAQGVKLSDIPRQLNLGVSGIDPRLLAAGLQCEGR
jgi:hypothetical protein